MFKLKMDELRLSTVIQLPFFFFFWKKEEREARGQCQSQGPDPNTRLFPKCSFLCGPAGDDWVWAGRCTPATSSTPSLISAFPSQAWVSSAWCQDLSQHHW